MTRANNKRGQKQYQPDMPQRAYKLCLLGLTNEQLATAFGVRMPTIEYWLAHKPEFREAVENGRRVADSNVAESLYIKATGFHYTEKQVKVTGDDKEVTTTTKYLPPDAKAAIFWLKNRDRERWSDRVENQITGKDGGPVEISQNKGVDISNLNPDEVAQLIELGIKVRNENKEDENE